MPGTVPTSASCLSMSRGSIAWWNGRGRNLHFSTDVAASIATADIVFISVNTPTKTKGLGAGQASDLRWVEAVPAR